MEKKVVKEKVVPLEIAVLLKAKGFDYKIESFYNYIPPAASIKSKGGYKSVLRSYVAYSNSEWESVYKDVKESFWKGLDDKHPNISAPTYSMAIDFLLEKGYHVMAVTELVKGENKWTWAYTDFKLGEEVLGRLSKEVNDRYTALNKGMLEVLKKL